MQAASAQATHAKSAATDTAEHQNSSGGDAALAADARAASAQATQAKQGSSMRRRPAHKRHTRSKGQQQKIQQSVRKQAAATQLRRRPAHKRHRQSKGQQQQIQQSIRKQAAATRLCRQMRRRPAHEQHRQSKGQQRQMARSSRTAAMASRFRRQIRNKSGMRQAGFQHPVSLRLIQTQKVQLMRRGRDGSCSED